MAHGLVLFSSQCGYFDGSNLVVRVARVLEIWMFDVVLVLP